MIWRKRRKATGIETIPTCDFEGGAKDLRSDELCHRGYLEMGWSRGDEEERFWWYCVKDWLLRWRYSGGTEQGLFRTNLGHSGNGMRTVWISHVDAVVGVLLRSRSGQKGFFLFWLSVKAGFLFCFPVGWLTQTRLGDAANNPLQLTNSRRKQKGPTSCLSTVSTL
jgi:hypothetical protein